MALVQVVRAMVAVVVLAIASPSETTADRQQILPSLECSCQTSPNALDRFNLRCQRADLQELKRNGEAAHTLRTDQSTFTCTEGQRASAGEWWLAEVAGRGAYRLSARSLTWREAVAACDALREQQVALDGGDAELKALLRAFAFAANNTKELLYVGIRYWPSEKDFYTVRGQKMANLTWRPDHPLFNENQHCVTTGIEGKLHGPHGCKAKRRFFCKRY